MQKIELDNNIELFYNKADQKDVVNLALLLPIAQDWETVDNAGILEITADLLMKGSKKYDSIEISEWLEDHVVSFDCEIQSSDMMITIKCLTADLDKMLDIFIDGFNRPLFSENEIELWKERTQSRFDRRSTTARYQHQIFRNGVLYGPKTRQGMILADIVAKQMQYSQVDIRVCWDKFFKVDHISLAVNGDIFSDQAVDYARMLKSRLRKGSVTEPVHKLKIPEGNLSFSQEYKFEQVNLDINISAPDVNNPDFKVMKVINALFNRSDGGLHKATRGTNNLAYFAYASYATNHDYGFLRLTSQTSLENRDELIQVLVQELNNMMNIEISQDEIRQVLSRNEIIRRNNISADYLPSLILNSEADGLGYDWYAREMDELSNVTAEDIRRVATQYFQNKAIIVSFPSEDFQRKIE